MMKRIDSSDHLRLSIVPGKNNLSGILWMWNPLMRFLLFLHYTHIVSARWGPLVGQGRPRAGIVRGNHQAGWHTGPRLKFSFLGNQFRDQGSILRTAKGTVRYTPPIDRFLALFPLVILNHQAFLSLYEICVQKNSTKKGSSGFARWCWSQEMWSHFLRKPPTVAPATRSRCHQSQYLLPPHLSFSLRPACYEPLRLRIHLATKVCAPYKRAHTEVYNESYKDKHQLLRSSCKLLWPTTWTRIMILQPVANGWYQIWILWS